MTKMASIYKYVSMNGDRLPKPLTTLYQLNEFIYAFKQLAKSKTATFLSLEVKELFEKFNFTVNQNGIGYEVAI